MIYDEIIGFSVRRTFVTSAEDLLPGSLSNHNDRHNMHDTIIVSDLLFRIGGKVYRHLVFSKVNGIYLLKH